MQPLAVIETHPVQYHAPVYRSLHQKYGIPVTVIYGSDFSVAGYHDKGFGTTVAWNTDLLSGYTVRFLSRVGRSGSQSSKEISSHRLHQALYAENPAAVLLLGYHPQFYLSAFWQVRRAGYPLLLRAETTDHASHRQPWKAWGRDTFLRWFYRHFVALLPIGQHSARHYNRLASKGTPHFFSPYCVDITAFEPEEAARERLRMATRRSLDINENALVILFAGKLIPKKAPELLLNAVKQLPARERDNIVVLFLGDGELRHTLENLAAETPAINTRFVGFQNQTALSPFYHTADMLVLPSRYAETWGLVVNEALHHGLPCVVSDQVGCAPDLIVTGKTGGVFAADRVAELADAITKVLSLVNQPEVRLHCREQVSKYTVEHAAAGIAEAFTYVTRKRSAMRAMAPSRHLA